MTTPEVDQAVELDGFAADALARYVSAQVTLHAARATADEARAELVKAMGTASLGTMGGKPYVRVTLVESARFDAAAFRRHHAALYEQYVRPIRPYHRVTLL